MFKREMLGVLSSAPSIAVATINLHNFFLAEIQPQFQCQMCTGSSSGALREDSTHCANSSYYYCQLSRVCFLSWSEPTAIVYRG